LGRLLCMGSHAVEDLQIAAGLKRETMPSAGNYTLSSLAEERWPSMRKASFNGRVSFALAAFSRLS
jgi:hypothetical protein